MTTSNSKQLSPEIVAAAIECGIAQLPDAPGESVRFFINPSNLAKFVYLISEIAVRRVAEIERRAQ